MTANVQRLPSVSGLALAAALFIAGPLRSDAVAGIGIVAGLQHDAPAVRDAGRGFASEGSWRPLVGLLLSRRIGTRWRAEGGALYAKRVFSSSAFVTDTPVRADFFDLGVVAIRELGPPGPPWALSVQAGPQAGLRLRARRRFREVDQDVTGELHEADLRMIGGLRLARVAGRSRFFLEGRFAWGLTNLDNTEQQEVRSRGLTVAVGWTR